MTSSSQNERRFSVVLIAASVPALASGLLITFSSDHSPRLGLISLLVFCLGTIGAKTLGLVRPPLPGQLVAGAFTFSLVGSLVITVVSFLALMQPRIDPMHLDGTFAILVSSAVGVVVVGDVMLSLAVSDRQLARDFRTGAVAGIVLALGEVVLPLTSIWSVGLFGAYGIVTGILFAISGMSIRFKTSDDQPTGKKNP